MNAHANPIRVPTKSKQPWIMAMEDILGVGQGGVRPCGVEHASPDRQTDAAAPLRPWIHFEVCKMSGNLMRRRAR